MFPPNNVSGVYIKVVSQLKLTPTKEFSVLVYCHIVPAHIVHPRWTNVNHLCPDTCNHFIKLTLMHIHFMTHAVSCMFEMKVRSVS